MFARKIDGGQLRLNSRVLISAVLSFNQETRNLIKQQISHGNAFTKFSISDFGPEQPLL
jgi:hypothetical protein